MFLDTQLVPPLRVNCSRSMCPDSQKHPRTWCLVEDLTVTKLM